jgi:hypothetical protein
MERRLKFSRENFEKLQEMIDKKIKMSAIWMNQNTTGVGFPDSNSTEIGILKKIDYDSGRQLLISIEIEHDSGRKVTHQNWTWVRAESVDFSLV